MIFQAGRDIPCLERAGSMASPSALSLQRAVNKCSERFPTGQDFADAGADPAYCTITVIGAPCEIPPDVAVIVRFTFPRATPLVLPQPANPNTPTRITAARTIANRTLRIHLKEMSRCLLAAIKNNARSETQRASG